MNPLSRSRSPYRPRSRSLRSIGIGIATLVLAAHSAFANDAVDPNDMQRYCKAEAANHFDQRPSNITTHAVEHVGSGYRVYGQFPPLADNPTAFECRFDANRTFRD